MSSYPGYQNFTTDNFYISGSSTKINVSVHRDSYGSSDYNFSNSATVFSYNVTSGILTIVNNVSKTYNYSSGSSSISGYHVYLAYN